MGESSVDPSPLTVVRTTSPRHPPGTRLLFLHEKGAAHGRLHPGNVLLTQRFKVKLSDYKGSSLVTPVPPELLQGADAAHGARWAYLAPEVAARALRQSSADVAATSGAR